MVHKAEKKCLLSGPCPKSSLINHANSHASMDYFLTLYFGIVSDLQGKSTCIVATTLIYSSHRNPFSSFSNHPNNVLYSKRIQSRVSHCTQLPCLACFLPSGTVPQFALHFHDSELFFFSFFFAFILKWLWSQGVSKIVQKWPMYPLPSFFLYQSGFSREPEQMVCVYVYVYTEIN